ncbi:hypothetical protein [Aeromonas veronii]|uniref:hypothetical protein n=1 Tax=Aeromonas veronii TaxID=654 RepID=UPI0011B1FE19|nr:hypothetical protein [Aeromonas veronii]
MTAAQYRRLLIVITLPLLIAGGIFTRAVIRPHNYIAILCGNPEYLSEKCRTTDGLGKPWHEEIKSQHPIWFNINTSPYESNSFPYAFVSGSPRSIPGVHIVSVTPYLGTDGGPSSPIEQLRKMAGKKISIQFGYENMTELNPLGCNELTFNSIGNTYTAGLCSIPNGTAQVKFTVGAEGSRILSELKANIDDEISRQRNRIIIDYAIGTPMFLIIFLMGSLLVWTVKRANSYIRNGSCL